MTKLDQGTADAALRRLQGSVLPKPSSSVSVSRRAAKGTGEPEIGCNTHVGPEVTLGRGVTVAPGAQLWGRVVVGDNVTIGPNVVISPATVQVSSGELPNDSTLVTTVLRSGCSIEGGAVLREGVRIGSEAVVLAGAVVTQDVPSRAIVEGNPARIVDYVGVAPLPEELSARPKRRLSDAVDPFLTPLDSITDLRGGITVLESKRDIPFEPARIFLVHSVPSSSLRGEHAHRVCAQYCVATAGSMRLVLDDGHQRRQYLLQPFQQGVYIPPMVWGVQYKFTRDAVMMVVASHTYDPNDYIRDYDTWRSELA